MRMAWSSHGKSRTRACSKTRLIAGYSFRATSGLVRQIGRSREATSTVVISCTGRASKGPE